MEMTMKDLKEMVTTVVAEGIAPLSAEVASLKAAPASPGFAAGATGEIETPVTRAITWYKNFFKGFASLSGDGVAAARETCEKISGKAMTVGSSTGGGYMVPVPQDMIGEIQRVGKQASVLLQKANLIPMVSETLPLTKETSGVTFTWRSIGENTGLPETTPVIGRSTLTAKRGGGYTEVSNVLLESADSDVVAYLNMLFGEAYGESIDTVGFAGVALSGDPMEGLLTDTAISDVTMEGGLIGFENVTPDYLSLLISKLSARLQGEFFFNGDMVHVLRTLKDLQGRPLFSEPTVGQPGSIYGRPFNLVDVMPALTATAANTGFILFGDMKKLPIGNRKEMFLSVNPYAKFLEGISQIKVEARLGWIDTLPVPSAFKRLKTAAS